MADKGRCAVLSDKTERSIDNFIAKVKRRKSEGRSWGTSVGMEVARDAAKILIEVVSEGTSFQVVMETVKIAGRRMMEASPFGPLIGNVVRRVLYILRDEYQITKKEMQKEGKNEAVPTSESSNDEDKLPVTYSTTYNPALASQLTTFLEVETSDDVLDFDKFQDNSIEHLTNNFVDDFSTVYHSIQAQATDHIADGDVILTYGHSKTTERFFLFARKKKITFQLYIVEGAPDCSGHELAAKMLEQDIETTVIPDTAAYAVMLRCTKVILGTYLVVANGGLIAPAGTHGVALAAHMHRVPVIVCTAMIKLTPTYPSTIDLSEYGKLRDPGEVLPFDTVAAAAGSHCYTGGERLNLIEVVNPSVDYVPPELIALFVTNDDEGSSDSVGRSYPPSYIYRLLLQFYNPEDGTF